MRRSGKHSQINSQIVRKDMTKFGRVFIVTLSVLLSTWLLFHREAVHADTACGREMANAVTTNKELVLRALNELWNERDVSAVERYWGDPYIQHNPDIPNGREGLKRTVAGLKPGFKYEPGMIVAEGDLVMVHGRYTEWGPKPVVTVEIFRIKDGRLVEHWDVTQEEVPVELTKSGNPMFTPK